jgi:hypothetical protein
MQTDDSRQQHPIATNDHARDVLLFPDKAYSGKGHDYIKPPVVLRHPPQGPDRPQEEATGNFHQLHLFNTTFPSSMN